MAKGKKKISYMCTAFRDGFQSVFGARVLSKDYLPVVAEAVKAGMTNIEAGGGASFQAAFFYNNENAFDVMDEFRRICGPKVNLQTLARGVNVVALDSQSSDMIDLHAKMFKKHGMSTIRNFDALNDPNNLIFSAKCIKKAGLKHQLCVSMMSLPPGAKGAHTPDFYEDTLKKIIKAKIPFDSLCFKDASGTTTPTVVFETISRARKLIGQKVPIEFHSHETAGTGLACYLAAVQGGADIVDLSMAPVSGGTCQPDIATMWHALRGMDYELDCDIDAIMHVEDCLKDALSDYFMPPEALHVEPMIPWSPMPGGA
ncbi:MAG: biotin attachment protein, partial [Alphaproteobacteria bacterium]|nr:biotin attachment protein [Alphaproteobacteria bacterium]